VLECDLSSMIAHHACALRHACVMLIGLQPQRKHLQEWTTHDACWVELAAHCQVMTAADTLDKPR
jgi:hypothetical protein